MHVTVVYESFFGCTRAAAEAIAAGVRDSEPDTSVAVYAAADAPPEAAGCDLLVIGGPTHLLGLSSPVSRWLQAQWWGDPVLRLRSRRPYGRPSRRRSLAAWLDGASPVPGASAAAFCTGTGGPFSGSAARTVARRLRRRGLRLVAAPETFVVCGVTGPLPPQELARARAWGVRIAHAAGMSLGSRG
jgi:hypothetical protein